MAGHAMLWGFVLAEVPRQVLAHNRKVNAAAMARIAELDRYFPGAEEVDEQRRLIANRTLTPSIATPSGPVPSPVVSIVRRLVEFPRHEAHVDFALNRTGEIEIRCIGVNGPRLPAMLLRGPRDLNEAREKATVLVEAAIRTLATD